MTLERFDRCEHGTPEFEACSACIIKAWGNAPRCSCGYPDSPCTRTQTDCARVKPRPSATSDGTATDWKAHPESGK